MILRLFGVLIIFIFIFNLILADDLNNTNPITGDIVITSNVLNEDPFLTNANLLSQINFFIVVIILSLIIRPLRLKNKKVGSLNISEGINYDSYQSKTKKFIKEDLYYNL